jgi:tripartite-type tricarboxylate transporter receptor subunit TctC
LGERHAACRKNRADCGASRNIGKAIALTIGTAAAILKRLNEALVRVLGRADVKEKFLAAGVEPVGSTPQQLAATIKSEIVRMSKVIKDAGIREE